MPTTEAVTESAPGGRDAAPPPSGRSVRLVVSSRIAESSLTVLCFLALFAGYGIWLGSTFLNVDARLLDIHVNVPILLLGLAVLITLIPGRFDLSVASMATLTTFLTIGLTVNQGWSFPIVLLFCLGVGMAGGLINGLLVEKVGVDAFIATLGTGGVFAGISAVYSGGTQLTPGAAGPQLPGWFTDLGSAGVSIPTWLGVLIGVFGAIVVIIALARLRPADWTLRRWLPVEVAAFVVLALILIVLLDLPSWLTQASWMVALLMFVGAVLWVFLEYTSSGRYLRAIGSNRTASRLAGVNVQWEVIKAFVMGGVLAALAGVCLAAGQGSASPDIAASFLLPAFAAAFLSTVVFSRGRFTVWGTIVGGIFLVWVSQGLILGGVSPTWSAVVNGVVLVGAVGLSSVMRRGR